MNTLTKITRTAVITIGLLIAALWLGISWSSFYPPSRYEYKYPVVAGPSLERQINFYKERLLNNPTSALERVALAKVYLVQAKALGENSYFDKAQSVANESLEILPYFNLGALVVLAKVAEARHRFVKAIAIAQRVLDANPRDTSALSILVSSNLGKGDLDSARIASDKLISLKPVQGNYALRALVMEAQGEDEKAISDFEKALRVEDMGEARSSIWTRTMMGRFYLRRGEYGISESLLKAALKIDPESHLALFLLGVIAEKRGESNAAERKYSKAYRLSGEPPYILRHARLKVKLGETKEALRMRTEIEKSIREEYEQGDYAHPHELVALLLDKGSKFAITEAVEVAKRDADHRQNADTLYQYALSLAKSGQWLESKKVLSTLFSSGVRQAPYFALGAKVESALGNAEQQLVMFEKALKTDPTFVADKKVW